MKKIITTILAIIMLFTSVSAGAQALDFLKEEYNNYSCEGTISVTFENSHELVALLEELELPKEVSYFVDLESLFKTLSDYDGKITMQADISDDFNKIKIGFKTESSHNVVVNPNLNIGVNAKEGMWLNMDLSDEENPVFDITISAPLMNKYMKIDVVTLAGDEFNDVLDVLKKVLNKDYITALNKNSVDLFLKHATINGFGSKYTATMDNDAFISYLDEVMSMSMDMALDTFGEEYADQELAFPSLKGLHILGKNGIKNTYTLKNNKISTAKTTVDINIDIKEIYAAMTGEEWPYSASGSLDFTITSEASYTRLGSTKVNFPILTADNSFSIEDLMPTYEDPDISYEEAEPEYPHWYVSGYCENLPVIDNNIYVPLRMTIESAYDNTASISYQNGTVTINCEHFPDFDTLKLVIGSDKVYAGDKEYDVGNVILIDDTTYVNHKLFYDIFGWNSLGAVHDMIEDNYHYSFYTQSF